MRDGLTPIQRLKNGQPVRINHGDKTAWVKSAQLFDGAIPSGFIIDRLSDIDQIVRTFGLQSLS